MWTMAEKFTTHTTNDPKSQNEKEIDQIFSKR